MTVFAVFEKENVKRISPKVLTITSEYQDKTKNLSWRTSESEEQKDQ